MLLLVVATVGACCICDLFAGSEDASFKVTGHTWTHEIAIETHQLEKDSSPCNKMPSGAERVTRQKQEPVCETRKQDQGDGTYKETRECKDQEDVCTYYVGKWKDGRTEKESGSSVDDRLSWPSVRLARTGTCDGCEREGSRKATYTVRFEVTGKGTEKTCEFNDASKWKSFKVGSGWKGKVGGFTGDIDCGSLSSE